eukprot:5555984-Amphidinium_carterae.1
MQRLPASLILLITQGSPEQHAASASEVASSWTSRFAEGVRYGLLLVRVASLRGRANADLSTTVFRVRGDFFNSHLWRLESRVIRLIEVESMGEALCPLADLFNHKVPLMTLSSPSSYSWKLAWPDYLIYCFDRLL